MNNEPFDPYDDPRDDFAAAHGIVNALVATALVATALVATIILVVLSVVLP